MDKSLYNKLIEYKKNNVYSFHMPGHKSNVTLLEGNDPFDIDITEIHDFDNLHNPIGIIKNAMENAASFWGVERTWFLINGSSCGILAAINAVTDISDEILIARNCHKSVYMAAELRGLKLSYLYPEYIEQYGISGGYNPYELEQILEKNNGIKAVVVTSPSYDGVVSDIEKIAEITHKAGAVLIVDEAHGAHFGITDKLPKPAYELGADLVIESIHKTLPSLTQTAMLHLCGNRVDENKVQNCLSIYESSSPSYVLMASIDKCIRYLQKHGREQLEELLITDSFFRNNVNKLKYIKVPGKELIGKYSVFDLDETKLVINISNKVCDSHKFADILREKYNFEMEMEGADYVLAITTICDKKEQIVRLHESLKEIDETLDSEFGSNSYISNDVKGTKEQSFNLLRNESVYSIYEAKRKSYDRVKLADSAGKISAEMVYIYPPGIPLLVPGERISGELLDQLKELESRNMNIQGLSDKDNKCIRIIEN